MQLGFFDLNDIVIQLSKIGDPLEMLNEKIDWSRFDVILNYARIKDIVQRAIHTEAGHKPFKFDIILR